MLGSEGIGQGRLRHTTMGRKRPGATVRSASRATMLILAVSAVVAVTQAGAATTHSASKACSTKGLHFFYKKGSTQYRDKVAHLRATSVQCNTARDVAEQVATDQLHQRKVPGTIDGLKVHVKNPCGGCTPVSRVAATQGGRKVTFKVIGG